MRNLDELWSDDLFGRREEADLIEGYLESVYARAPLREDVRSFTIAIEAGYGEGKTFFLKRLAKQLENSHPVAFVDAWADDLFDDPFTALAATLQSALKPWIASQPNVREQWNIFLGRAAKIAKITGVGLLKRSADLALGLGAGAAIQQVMTTVEPDTVEAVSEKLDVAATEIVDGVGPALAQPAPRNLLKQRIEDFEKSVSTVQEIRESLRSVIQALNESSVRPPIVIIIDELDRCRPTYAIKVFEEIKHLFDVNGLIFVFGTHTAQLAKSVGAVYGSNFNGSSYLRRFIQREYRLKEPNLLPLVRILASNLPLDARLYFPPLHNITTKMPKSVEGILGRYLVAYGVSAREAFQLFDILQTCLDLTDGTRLHGSYLIPLIIGQIKGKEPGQFADKVRDFGFAMSVSGSFRQGSAIQVPADIAQRFKELSGRSRDELLQAYNQHAPEYPVEAVFESVTNERDQLARTSRYPELLQTVGRFTVPDNVKETESWVGGVAK